MCFAQPNVHLLSSLFSDSSSDSKSHPSLLNFMYSSTYLYPLSFAEIIPSKNIFLRTHDVLNASAGTKKIKKDMPPEGVELSVGRKLGKEGFRTRPLRANSVRAVERNISQNQQRFSRYELSRQLKYSSLQKCAWGSCSDSLCPFSTFCVSRTSGGVY